MANAITIGRRLIPSDHIAFVEPYDAAANPDFQTARDFKSRVAMLDPRDSMLAEETPRAFAEAHGFRMLELDGVALNPAIHYRVESFAPTANFTPPKPYTTRLIWRDLDRKDQSKLLLTTPETVLAVAVRGNADVLTTAGPASRPARRKGASAAGATHTPEQ